MQHLWLSRWSCSLVVLSALTANPQKPETDVVVVPGFNAITGQRRVELKVWISPALANAVPAAAYRERSYCSTKSRGTRRQQLDLARVAKTGARAERSRGHRR